MTGNRYCIGHEEAWSYGIGIGGMSESGPGMGWPQVAISVIDKEAAKLGARINISWGEGDCYVEVPAEDVEDNVTHPSYLSVLSAQGTFALVLGGTLVFVVILGMVIMKQTSCFEVLVSDQSSIVPEF